MKKNLSNKRVPSITKKKGLYRISREARLFNGINTILNNFKKQLTNDQYNKENGLSLASDEMYL